MTLSAAPYHGTSISGHPRRWMIQQAALAA